MTTKLTKKQIINLLYSICNPAHYAGIEPELRDPNIGKPVKVSDSFDLLERWNGKPVRLWEMSFPEFDPDPKTVGMYLSIPLDCGTDCLGELVLRMPELPWYQMTKKYGQRVHMAIYDAVYKLFDGQVDFHYVPDCCGNKPNTPAEWQKREHFDDMPSVDDMDFGGVIYIRKKKDLEPENTTYDIQKYVDKYDLGYMGEWDRDGDYWYFNPAVDKFPLTPSTFKLAYHILFERRVYGVEAITSEYDRELVQCHLARLVNFMRDILRDKDWCDDHVGQRIVAGVLLALWERAFMQVRSDDLEIVINRDPDYKPVFDPALQLWRIIHSVNFKN